MKKTTLNSLSPFPSFFFSPIGRDSLLYASRPCRGFQGAQKQQQNPKKQLCQDVLFFFDFVCRVFGLCKQTSELSVSVDVDAVGGVDIWPMPRSFFVLASSSSPSPLFTAPFFSGAAERSSSLLSVASDSDDRVFVLEPAAAAAAAEAQCLVVDVVDSDAAAFIGIVVCSLCRSLRFVLLSLEFRSTNGR